MHTFSVDFLQSIIIGNDDKSVDIPIHVAKKKIAYFDKKRMKTIDKDRIDSPNGIKLEYFIFDTFKFATKLTTFAILRENEFSPVKNLYGTCSPITAVTDISTYWKNKIKQVTNGDVTIEDNKDCTGILEVSSMLSYDGEGKEFYHKIKGKVLKLPLFLS